MKNIRRQIPVRRYTKRKRAEDRQKELRDIHGLVSKITPVTGGFEVSPEFTTKDGKTKVVKVNED